MNYIISAIIYFFPFLLLFVGGYYEQAWASDVHFWVGVLASVCWVASYLRVALNNPMTVYASKSWDGKLPTVLWTPFILVGCVTMLLGWTHAAIAYFFAATFAWLYVRQANVKIEIAQLQEERRREVMMPQHKLN